MGVPPTETYEVLSKDTADGTVFPWEGVAAFNLAEVLENHTAAGFYTTSFWFAMNEDTYAGLSSDAQSCVDAASYRALVNRTGEYWDAWDVLGHDQAVAAGNAILIPTEEEQAVWAEAMTPVIELYHDSLREGGIDNVDEIYTRAQELVAEYQADYEAFH